MLAGGLPPSRLFPNAVNKELVESLARFASHCHFSRFYGVLELSVIALGGDDTPAVSLKQFNNLSYFVSFHNSFV